MWTEVTQLLQGRFRTIDSPTVFKVDTESDTTRWTGSLFQNFTIRTELSSLLQKSEIILTMQLIK